MRFVWEVPYLDLFGEAPLQPPENQVSEETEYNTKSLH